MGSALQHPALALHNGALYFAAKSLLTRRRQDVAGRVALATAPPAAAALPVRRRGSTPSAGCCCRRLPYKLGIYGSGIRRGGRAAAVGGVGKTQHADAGAGSEGPEASTAGEQPQQQQPQQQQDQQLVDGELLPLPAFLSDGQELGAQNQQQTQVQQEADAHSSADAASEQQQQQQQPPDNEEGSGNAFGGFTPSSLLQPGALLSLDALRQLQPSKQQQQQLPVGRQLGEAPALPPGLTAASQPATPGSSSAAGTSAAHIGTLWGLLVLSLAYLHHSTTGFALPALLPIISEDLHLSDNQGALLTAGYTVLYALTLVPMGLLADRMDRPRLLAGGIALWSVLTMAASESRSFGQLLATRVGFAAAQATQNPICFSLIPELFPKNRTMAMAVYNTAIYAGRALSFAALLLAGQLGVSQAVIGDISVGYTLVPLDKVDLSLVSILYTQGDFAAIAPVYSYGLDGDPGVPIESAFSAWRTLLRWLGPPGLFMAAMALLTVEEPRQRGKGGKFMPLVTLSSVASMDEGDMATAGAQGAAQGQAPAGAPLGAGAAPLGNGAVAGAAAGSGVVPLDPTALVSVPEREGPGSIGDSLGRLRGLVASPAFLSLTMAAAFNDVGSWALVSWQATFYQRVYELQPSTYAPLLAVVIPVGGIIGGVGAGVFGDWLNRIGARGWLTAGSCIAAAPLIATSLLVPDYKQSFAALLVGFAFSECWRAPAAVMVREVSPPGLGSTASAMHLCIRNLVGGLGPIGVALLSAKVGLQVAMLIVPVCYLLSGLGLAVTEVVIKKEKDKARAERHEQHLLAAGTGEAAGPHAGGDAGGGTST